MQVSPAGDGRTVTIARRFRGPLHSANGGYAAGVLARELAGTAEVTLRRPPPLDRPLELALGGDVLLLRDGAALVAEARPGDPDLHVPPAPAFDDLDGGGVATGWGTADFGECFSCGHRADGDGLGIHPQSRPDGYGVAAAWVAREVSIPVVWAAIDCSGAYAVGDPGRGEPLLARMTARVDRLPAEGTRCVVIGWPLGADGRKLHAGTAVVDEDGAVLARSRQLWILPRN